MYNINIACDIVIWTVIKRYLYLTYLYVFYV